MSGYITDILSIRAQTFDPFLDISSEGSYPFYHFHNKASDCQTRVRKNSFHNPCVHALHALGNICKSAIHQSYYMEMKSCMDISPGAKYRSHVGIFI